MFRRAAFHSFSRRAVGDSVADEFVEKGVLPEQVVLAWQHPARRKLTEFAVA